MRLFRKPFGQCLGLPKGHLGWSLGVILVHFDPKHYQIGANVSYYQFENQITHKTCKDILAQKRLVFELRGRSLTFNLQTLQD